MTGMVPGVPDAGPAVQAPAPVPADAALICVAIGDAYPDWVVWWCRGMFCARRSGSFREIAGDKARYLIMHAHPSALLMLLDEQDRIRELNRWDAPGRLADPTIQVHGESHVALKAGLPAPGKPPPGAR